MAVVECCNEPDIPVTVIVYVPGGVVELPLPPPHATVNINTLSAHVIRVSLVRCRRVLRGANPKSAKRIPTAGSQIAYKTVKPRRAGLVVNAAIPGSVLTVRVIGGGGALVFTEFGDTEHCGANSGDGDTEQLSETGLLKPFVAPMVTVELADPPPLTVLGVRAEAEIEKSATS